MFATQPIVLYGSRVSCRQLSASSKSSGRLRRYLATSSSNPKKYDACIIGAGPGGITSASHLLEQGLQRICMIDPSFTAGRINEKYREVPSNTKTVMFEKWATGTRTSTEIIKASPSPNAYEMMLSFDQDKGCDLGAAADVAQLISDGLRKDPRVHSIPGTVSTLLRSDNNDVWTIPELDLIADRVVLAVGSHPKKHDLADKYPHITPLDLDVCLKPSELKKTLPAGSRIAVIGASHSAILAIMNLYNLGNVEVINFHRSALLYAIYKDGWILHDNTGLKGIAADWARSVLAAETLPKNLRRVNMKSDENKDKSEKEIYDVELKDVTHLVSAIGYAMNPVPKVIVAGKEIRPEYNPLNGRFLNRQGSQEVLPGLFGAGIAYPERVTDKAGNVESAVGCKSHQKLFSWTPNMLMTLGFKFNKYLTRVAPGWVKHP